MITKREFCLHKIEEIAKNMGKDIVDLKENDITYSSTMAVVMEYLGLIKNPEIEEYVSSRGGKFIVTSFSGMLSVREMIELLPDKSDEEFRFLMKEMVDKYDTFFQNMTGVTYETYSKEGPSDILKDLWKLFRAKKLKLIFEGE